MSALGTKHMKYGFSRTVDLPFEGAVERACAALKDEGFDVLSEIDIREKLGVDFRRYVILGACSPSHAHKALREESEIGLLLPCNVIVYEADEEEQSVVAAVDARAMLSVVGSSPALDAVSSEVNERLRRAPDGI